MVRWPLDCAAKRVAAFVRRGRNGKRRGVRLEASILLRCDNSSPNKAILDLSKSTQRLEIHLLKARRFQSSFSTVGTYSYRPWPPCVKIPYPPAILPQAKYQDECKACASGTRSVRYLVALRQVIDSPGGYAPGEVRGTDGANLTILG